MRLFLFAIGDRTRASSRLRVWDHVEWLRAQGHDVVVAGVVPRGMRGWRLLAATARRLPGWVVEFFRADGIFMQEALVLSPLLPFRRWGKPRRVIYDFSDPIDLLGQGPQHGVRRLGFKLATRLADHVIFENGLYRQRLHQRGDTITQFYGPVDCVRYQNARQRRLAPRAAASAAVHVGWTGSPSTLGLIRPLFPALVPLLRAGRISLTLVGLESVPPEFSGLPVAVIPWDEAREFELVPTFELGLFGLDDSEHCKYRGAGKLFIYMAAGVPFIATNLGIARELMDQTGVGFRVDAGDWAAALDSALAQAEGREQFSLRSMQIACDTFSYERYRELLGRQFPGETTPAWT